MTNESTLLKLSSLQSSTRKGSAISAPDPLTPVRRLSPLRELWPFLRPYRRQIALALLLLCLGSATILVVPLAFRDLIDERYGSFFNPPLK